MRKTTILVTGCSGSIGIHVLSYVLSKTDWNLVVLDSFRHKGYKDRINRVLKDHPEWKERITQHQHDLVCPISPELQARIGPADYILHLAALSDVFLSIENPVYAIQNNVNSTLMILEYARAVCPKQFIYFSTDEVYGPVKSGDAHDEWDTHRPSNAYAASKAACEDICYAYWRSYNVPLIITNTMNNFGEMQSSSKFPVIVQKAVDSGDKVIIHGNRKETGTRFYIHSWNVADAIVHIIKQGARLHEVGELDSPLRYHIVGDECLSNLEMAHVISELLDKPLHFEMVDFHKDNPAHDIHYGLQNNTLFASGWKQPIPFKESMKKTIEWQRENPEWIQ